MADLLWTEKEYIKFDDKAFRISETCESVMNDLIPYRREYGNLTPDELQKLIQDARKHRWQALDLTMCGLTELPDELWSLTDLRLLYLGNSIHGQSVKGNENKFLYLPRAIEKLQHLKVLSLFGLTVSVEGKKPLNLEHLVHLELFRCNYKEYPNAFVIPSLEGLAVSDLLVFPASFFYLSNLTDLYMYGYGFSNIPDWIGSLSKLRTLSLCDGSLEDLPASMINLKNLQNLRIYDTPLEEKIPEEIHRQSAQEIIRYVLKMQDDTPKEYFNESKMIIVGQPQVGKSSLLERLVHKSCTAKDSTEGINIERWIFYHDGEEYRLNLWDFGGQEIYHSTHQFFLTQRALYVLVWDALSEDEYGRIDYWLRTIQSFANDSKIFIVVNKCDLANGRRKKLYLEEYKERYPQILDICEVSCRDNYGIDELREKIQYAAVELPLMKTPWITSWLNVRWKLEGLAKKENHITYSTYLDICRGEGLSDEDALSLAKYLHDLGVILYYEDDLLLRNMVILSSEWGTDAVYKILDEQERHLKGRNGILYPNADLDEIWTDQNRYPRDYHQHLLNLMVNFRLSFRINDNEYLVAELLEDRPIRLDYSFPFGQTLTFRLDYDFLPAGIMTRFIVAAHENLEIQNGVRQCWKKGAYLRHGSAYALVQLFDTPPERHIMIRVSGSETRYKQELLTIIRTELEKISALFNKLNITRKIPCICHEDCPYFFPYDTLMRAEAKAMPTVQCQYSLDYVSTRKLLDGVESIMEYRPDKQLIFNNNNYNTYSPVNTVTATNTNTSSNTNTNSVAVSVEVKNLINGFYEDFNDLRTEVNEPNFDDQCKKVDEALKTLDNSSSEEEMKRSGALKKLERFLRECHDPESNTGKLLAGVKYAGGIALDLGKKYNKLADLLGAPKIPLIGS